MALSSQGSRGSRGSMASGGGRRQRRWGLAIICVVIAVGLFGYFVWPGGGSTASQEGQGNGTPEANATNPRQLNDTPQTPPRAQPTGGPSANQSTGNTKGTDSPGSSASATSNPDLEDPEPQTEQLNLTGEDDRPADVPRLDGSAPPKSNNPGGGQTASTDQDSTSDSSAGGAPSQATSNRVNRSTLTSSGLSNVSMDDLSDRAGRRAREGMKMLGQGQLVQGRAVLSQLLFSEPTVLSAADAEAIRTALARTNEKLVFSPRVYAGDPLAHKHTVKPGDVLSRIGRQYAVPYPFLERINQIHARRLQAGQTIKVIEGPFHARIDKSEFRMDLYLTGPSGQRLYIRSYPIGLGKEGSTPVGKWRIKPGSKVVNPNWANPRTGEFFAKDDPENPIGEYWLALEGTESRTEAKQGYGIHGTIDPSSIGKQSSMGCVRLRSNDIERIFGMFASGKSTVQIQP